MPQLHVLRVFVTDDGGAGNPLGVFLAGSTVPEVMRQTVAADLGFSETVFVDDPDRGVLRIFTPASELPFAGHPLVGTAWLLRESGLRVGTLHPPAGPVPTWVESGRTWIRGRPEWVPGMTLDQLASPAAIDALDGSTDGYFWAWQDEPSGQVRSRFFARSLGILEDPATGAAAVCLVAQLGRPILIEQGAGSILHARPGRDGSAEVGGLVVLDGERDYRMP